jgi:hypothetical protein
MIAALHCSSVLSKATWTDEGSADMDGTTATNVQRHEDRPQGHRRWPPR